MEFRETNYWIFIHNKIMTTRVVANGHWLENGTTVRNSEGRKIRGVGDKVRVQPGRGQKGIGMIQITAIQSIRLHEFTDAHAIAEGVYPLKDDNGKILGWSYPGLLGMTFPTALLAYQHLWNKVNRYYKWDTDPQVFTYTFNPIHIFAHFCVPLWVNFLQSNFVTMHPKQDCYSKVVENGIAYYTPIGALQEYFDPCWEVEGEHNGLTYYKANGFATRLSGKIANWTHYWWNNDVAIRLSSMKYTEAIELIKETYLKEG